MVDVGPYVSKKQVASHKSIMTYYYHAHMKFSCLFGQGQTLAHFKDHFRLTLQLQLDSTSRASY